MILLADRYEGGSILLRDSLQRAELECPVIAITENGFLPADVMTPYAWYTGWMDMEWKPMYFDEAPIPYYWEIDADSTKGVVKDQSDVRARMFYAEPKYKRYVKIIDWLDRNGHVRVSDHYNQSGKRFAQTVLDGSHHPVMKLYYTENGSERITENLVTGQILLHENGKTRVFRNKTEFTTAFLRDAELDIDRILYNSLASPYFVTLQLQKEGIPGNDILFWQEKFNGSIPGNMRQILQNNEGRTKKIVIQDFQEFAFAQNACQDHSIFEKLGFIYPFSEKRHETKNILVLTNSDQIDHLEELVTALPDHIFHVAAVTEMSSKLLAFGSRPNVKLYPNVKMKKAEELKELCGIYLDINRGDEILNGTADAFCGDLVILGWKNLIHNPSFVPVGHRCEENDVTGMTEMIRRALGDPGYREKMIQEQHTYAMAESAEAYRRVILGSTDDQKPAAVGVEK